MRTFSCTSIKEDGTCIYKEDLTFNERVKKMKKIKATCVKNVNDFKVGEVYEFTICGITGLYKHKKILLAKMQFCEYFKIGHPHADLMAKAAEIAKTDCEWWKHFEVKPYYGNWREKNESAFMPHLEFRLKPKTITIGKYEVPEPVREPLNDGDSYYVAAPNLGRVYEYHWNNDGADFRMLKAGIIHLTQEAAEIHSKALLQWTMKDE